jgi:two-component system cell cycle sensor histidine kinase/response regulator CckA
LRRDGTSASNQDIDPEVQPHAVDEVRGEIADTAIITFVIIATPTLAASLTRALDVGWQPLMYLHVALYLVLLGVVVLRGLLPFRVKAWIFLSGLFALGVGSILTWSLAGSGIMFFMMTGILATVLFGTRAGVILTGCSILVVSATGLGVYLGRITFSIDMAAYVLASSSWITMSLGMGLFTLAIVVGLGRLHSFLIRSFSDLNERTSELMQTNRNLQAEIRERARAEESLRQSEEKYRLIFENIQDVYYETSVSGTIMEISPSVEHVYGYTREELIGTSILDIHTSPEPRKSLLDIISQEGAVHDYELVVHAKDGARLDCSVASRLLFDEEGNPWKICGSMRDISERKRTEAELVSHIRFLENMERVDEKVRGAHSKEQITHEVLETVREIFGCDRAWLLVPCDPDAPTYRVPMEATLPEYGGALELDQELPMGPDGKDLCRVMLESNGPVTLGPGSSREMHRHAAAFFSVQSLMAMAVHPSIGRPWVLGLHQCSHERVWTEEEKRLFNEIGHRITFALSSLLFLRDLRESEEKYRTLFEQSTDAILIIKPEGEIVDANDSCCRLFSAPREKIIGHSVLQFYWNPTDRVSLRSEIELHGFAKEFDWLVKRTDGSKRICMLTSSAWKDADGTIRAHLAIARDITESRQMEEQLRRSQKMEAIGTLAGGIAHDFNNLLQVVHGYAELALLDIAESNKVYKQLQEIRRAAKTAAELTDSLLTFSRQVESQLRPVNLNHELEQVVRMLRRTIPRMIEIKLKPAGNLDLVNADPSQLQQVLMNLGLNARDAMPDGGELVIQTRNVVLDAQYCTFHLGAEPGKYVVLEVTDSGQGMDKEALEHIFEPFYTTKDVGKGTGLGLAMVYGIVKGHHGHIFCYSEPGRGTSFKIYLPTIETEQLHHDTQQKEYPVGGDETILLVDDEETVRALGERILSRFGYSVFCAADGREGLEIFDRERNTISLIILDLIMPDMGGKECLEKIMKIDPSARVVIASGYAANGQIDAAVEAGAQASIRKPYEVRHMLEVVRRVLDGDC